MKAKWANDANTGAAAEVASVARRWVEKAVIGLNLCPFAGAVHAGNQIRYAVSFAQTPEALLEDLVRELIMLEEADPAKIETTLLIHPLVLTDFADYNGFLDIVDAAIDELGLAGVLQVASFHPQYRFAGTAADDIGNFTNRSPYPMLHLLREESIERAVQAHPDTTKIFEQNIETMRRLGRQGWRDLGLEPDRAATPGASRPDPGKE